MPNVKDKTLGIQCPQCGSTDSKVHNTHYNGGVTRYRRCDKCGHSYKTIEFTYAEYERLRKAPKKHFDLTDLRKALDKLERETR